MTGVRPKGYRHLTVSWYRRPLEELTWAENWAAAEHKQRTRSATYKLLAEGRLVRGPCVHCGATIGIEGHHPDYSRPDLIMWLCAPCHNREHTYQTKMARLRRAATSNWPGLADTTRILLTAQSVIAAPLPAAVLP